MGGENTSHAWFVLLITELLRELQEHTHLAPTRSGGLVHRALGFDVAAAVGCTPSHLAHLIRKETGLTVGDCLRETGDSVERIASQVGYGDVTHFIRTFRRVHGETPRAWREEHRRAAGPPTP